MSQYSGTTPIYLSNLLQKRCDKGSRADGKNLLAVSRVKKLTSGGRSFKIISPIVWNSLPVKLCLETNFKTFKKLLKTHIFNLAYGS